MLKREREAEKARALAEQGLAETGEKLWEMELKLAETESLSLAQATEIAELKVAFTTAEDKWYNASFSDVENSMEPIIYQLWCHGFGEGWVAALQAMRVPDDSLLRNPKQIPYPEPPLPPVQNPTDAEEEGDTPSMRALMEAIDSHVELVDLEITSNPDAQPRNARSSTLDPSSQPTEDAQPEQGDDTASCLPRDPAV